MPNALADLDECFSLLVALSRSETFDEALSLYLEISRKKMIPQLEQFTLGVISTPIDSKLPYQVRMFRQWTRLSSSLVKASKELYAKEEMSRYAEFELTNSDFE